MSHILWESILLYYGNLFLKNEGIFSQLVGNTFPQYMGQRHNYYNSTILNDLYHTPF